MESDAQKELKELCLNILRDDSPKAITTYLTQAQMLYENLLIQNYLNARNKAPEKTIETPMEKEPQIEVVETVKEAPKPIEKKVLTPSFEKETTKNVSIKEPTNAATSLNTQLNKGHNLKIGLNDRIAFIKHLFEGSEEDFKRVLSQINTFANYDEAASFIENMLKPDYNWADKEEYEERFTALVKAKFGEE